MSIDPRNVGAFEGDLEATAAALQHVAVDFGAIANGGTAIHDIAHKEIAEREAKAAALKAKLDAGEKVEAEVSAWGLNVPVTLRDKERYSDHDRANYLGAVVAIDYRHWVPGVVAHDGGSPSPAKSQAADGKTALSPFQPVAPLQFWHIYPSAEAPAAQEGEGAAAGELDCNRGSMAMTTSLRHAVDGLLVKDLGTSAEPGDRVVPWHWYRPEELADESKWNERSAGSIMTYRLQPAGAPRPTSQELLQTAAATWTPAVIPDVGQRAAIVRDIARSLLSADVEGSSFYDLAVRSKRRLYSADGDGSGFIERLVRLHPRYDDRGTLGGNGSATKDVFLLKLAQLTAIAFVEARGLFKDPTPFDFIDAEAALHVAPDYQLPKPLRACGLLRYSERLAALVDGCCLLPMGSAEEVELRVATMVAARALQRHLTEATGAPVSIAVVDYVLWYAGRMSSASQHHLTITHFY